MFTEDKNGFDRYTPTQKNELKGKLIFFVICLIALGGVIFFALKAETEKINQEKTRVEQSVKIHDYDDQKY